MFRGILILVVTLLSVNIFAKPLDRQKVFYDLAVSEDKARKEAEKKFPDAPKYYPPEKLDEYYSTLMDDRLKENDRLNEVYKRKLLKKYKINLKTLESIRFEGLNKNWPLPPL